MSTSGGAGEPHGRPHFDVVSSHPSVLRRRWVGDEDGANRAVGGSTHSRFAEPSHDRTGAVCDTPWSPGDWLHVAVEAVLASKAESRAIATWSRGRGAHAVPRRSRLHGGLPTCGPGFRLAAPPGTGTGCNELR